MLELTVEDITRLRVDAIVNAANETLLGGGGVDGAIHAAAGPGLRRACRALPEVELGVRCRPGEARLTGGHNLPAKWVIHTVGPVWRDDGTEDALLASCYRSCLTLARGHGLRSVAFPAISTGAYGFPIERAASIAVHELLAALAQPCASFDRLIACCYSPTVKAAYDAALAAHPPL